jgi:hypothetical protein
MGFMEKWRAKRENSRHDTQHKTYSPKLGDFPFLYPARLQVDHRFPIFFLPPWPERCPDGFVHSCLHALQVQPNSPPVRMWCLLEDGKDCYICDFLDAIRGQWETYPDYVKAQLQTLSVRKQTCFPVVIRAVQVADPDGYEGDKIWVPSEAEQGALLMIEDIAKTLVEGIEALFVDEDGNNVYEEVTNIDTGYYAFIRRLKSRKYEIQLSRKATGLKSKEFYTESRYPNVLKVLRNKKVLKEYEEQKALVESAWWTKRIFEDGPVDLGEDEEIPF